MSGGRCRPHLRERSSPCSCSRVSPAPQRAQTGAPAATLSSLPLAAGSLVSRTLGRDQVAYRIHRKRRRPRRTKRAPGALRPLRRARSPGALGRRHPLPAPARDGLRALAAAGRSRSAHKACKPRLLPARLADRVVCERPGRARAGIHARTCTRGSSGRGTADARFLAFWEPVGKISRRESIPAAGGSRSAVTPRAFAYRGLVGRRRPGARDLPARLELAADPVAAGRRRRSPLSGHHRSVLPEAKLRVDGRG